MGRCAGKLRKWDESYLLSCIFTCGGVLRSKYVVKQMWKLYLLLSSGSTQAATPMNHALSLNKY